MKTTFNVGVVVVALAVSGCGHVTGGVAPSTIPLAPGSYTELGEVQGQDCVPYLLMFLPLGDGNMTKTALADAMSKSGGADALINVTADTYSWNIILVSASCTEVFGTAIKLNDGSDDPAAMKKQRELCGVKVREYEAAMAELERIALLEPKTGAAWRAMFSVVTKTRDDMRRECLGYRKEKESVHDLDVQYWEIREEVGDPEDMEP